MKRLARYDLILLLFLSLLTLSLISRATQHAKKQEMTEEYTLLVEFSGEMPNAEEALSLYGHPISNLQPISDKRARLSVNGVRLSSGFFLGAERWIGANLSLLIAGESRMYEAFVLSLFGS